MLNIQYTTILYVFITKYMCAEVVETSLLTYFKVDETIRLSVLVFAKNNGCL